MTKALLIDYEYCDGCRSCEIACRNAHENTINVEQWGIKVLEDGPWKLTDDKYSWTFMPYPTSLCDLCAERTAEGRDPSCVHHCLGQCMEYGEASALLKKSAELGRPCVIFTRPN